MFEVIIRKIMISKVIVEWKALRVTEVYSSLTVLLNKHQDKLPPANTINNYISRKKVPFENETVKITRAKYISPETLKSDNPK